LPQAGAFLDQRAALVRPGPVADGVAKTPDRVDALGVDRRQHRVECVQVRVHV
jgi:hypothetical protein